MTISNPYYRIYRPFPTMRVTGSAVSFEVQQENADYVMDPRFAPDRIACIRAYELLEEELTGVFEYIEPADKNEATFSHQLYQLLLRACTDVESMSKAILMANGYKFQKNGTMADYAKIERACRLSEYEVGLPFWREPGKVVRPFREWGSANPLPWYQSYNSVKHNRNIEFERANLANAINAIAAVFSLLFGQFGVQCFAAYRPLGFVTGDEPGPFSHPNRLFTITPATSWDPAERYGFKWNAIKTTSSPFQCFPF